MRLDKDMPAADGARGSAGSDHRTSGGHEITDFVTPDGGHGIPPPVPPFEPGPRTAKGNPILGIAIVLAATAFIAGCVVTYLVFAGMH